MSAPKPLKTLGLLGLAWNASGGFSAFVRSFDLYVALFVWVLTTPFWLSPNWPEQVIAVLPNMLGFTLGGFAIFLGFGSDEFKGAIATSDESKSPYLSVSAAFMLFVAFQLAALLCAVVAASMFKVPPPALLAEYDSYITIASKIGSGFSYFLFCYSLALVLRAAIRIFRLSRWYNDYLTKKAKAQSKAP